MRRPRHSASSRNKSPAAQSNITVKRLDSKNAIVHSKDGTKGVAVYFHDGKKHWNIVQVKGPSKWVAPQTLTSLLKTGNAGPTGKH